MVQTVLLSITISVSIKLRAQVYFIVPFDCFYLKKKSDRAFYKDKVLHGLSEFGQISFEIHGLLLHVHCNILKTKKLLVPAVTIYIFSYRNVG